MRGMLLLTSPPLNKVVREQLLPRSNHLLLANSLTMQEQPAKQDKCQPTRMLKEIPNSVANQIMENLYSYF
jgi:hypothetical protein